MPGPAPYPRHEAKSREWVGEEDTTQPVQSHWNSRDVEWTRETKQRRRGESDKAPADLGAPNREPEAGLGLKVPATGRQEMREGEQRSWARILWDLEGCSPKEMKPGKGFPAGQGPALTRAPFGCPHGRGWS